MYKLIFRFISGIFSILDSKKCMQAVLKNVLSKDTNTYSNLCLSRRIRAAKCKVKQTTSRDLKRNMLKKCKRECKREFKKDF